MTRSTEYHPRARGGSARGRQVSSRRVRDLILASIREGTLDLDTQLVEEDLIRMFNSSRAAVRDALNELSDAGFLVRRPRLGTRVHRRDLGLELTAISGIGGESVEIVIREQRLVPNLPLVRTRLNIHDDHVRLVENTFHAFGETIGLRSAYFSASYDADPTELAGIPLTMERTAAEFFGTDPGDAWVSIAPSAAMSGPDRFSVFRPAAPCSCARSPTPPATAPRSRSCSIDSARTSYGSRPATIIGVWRDRPRRNRVRAAVDDAVTSAVIGVGGGVVGAKSRNGGVTIR